MDITLLALFLKGNVAYALGGSIVKALGDLTDTLISNGIGIYRQNASEKHAIAMAKTHQGYHKENVDLERKSYKKRLKANRANVEKTVKIKDKSSDQNKMFYAPSLMKMAAKNYNHKKGELLSICVPQLIEMDSDCTKHLVRSFRNFASQKYSDLVIHEEEMGVKQGVPNAAVTKILYDTLSKIPTAIFCVEDNKDNFDISLYCWFLSSKYTSCSLVSIPKSDCNEEICLFALMLTLGIVVDIYYLYKFDQAPTLLRNLSEEVLSTNRFKDKHFQDFISKLLLEVYIPMMSAASSSPAKLQGLLDSVQLSFMLGEDSLGYQLMSKLIVERGGEAPIRDRDSLRILAKELDSEDVIKLRKYLFLSDRKELTKDIDACFSLQSILSNNYSNGRSLL